MGLANTRGRFRQAIGAPLSRAAEIVQILRHSPKRLTLAVGLPSSRVPARALGEAFPKLQGGSEKAPTGPQEGSERAPSGPQESPRARRTVHHATVMAWRVTLMMNMTPLCGASDNTCHIEEPPLCYLSGAGRNNATSMCVYIRRGKPGSDGSPAGKTSKQSQSGCIQNGYGFR